MAEKQVVTTEELIEILIERSRRQTAAGEDCTNVEACLILVGGLRARHWMQADHETGEMWDEGIDSEMYETTVSAFLADYPGKNWVIEPEEEEQYV
jgi:hypothetical protein